MTEPWLPEPLSTLFVVAFGLVLGSFLNVCIYRLPIGESLVRPRSRCPKCGAPVRWRDNLPVVSWILLRGRCAACRAPISFRYPLVELLSAGILVGLWRGLGPGVAFTIAAGFALALLVLFFTDLDHQLLPDAVTLTGFATGIAISWVNPHLPGVGWARVWAALAGATLGAGLLWSVGAVYSRIRGVEAMGFGDVKMMAMVGAFTGPAGVLFTICVGSVFGAIVGIALIPLRGRTLADKLPFGCFLAPAALVAMFFARDALAAYLSLLHPPA